MDNQHFADNKRVVKNTLLLYMRMLITAIIGLFTTRYLLKALGVEDLGIYGVVGGVVGVLAFLNSAMSSASTRFISVALASGDIIERRKVFSTTFMMHFYIDLIILTLLETVGLWFVNTQLIIPPSRLFAANVVYQLSVFSCILGILSVPFNATLISHEKMGIYAYFTIFDVIFKLIITITVCFYNGDRLILYGILLLITFLVYYCINLSYCIKHFEDCKHITFRLDVNCAKGITKYLGWSMYTNTAHLSYLQGLSILLNLFFGPSANASRNIAGSIQDKVVTFVNNFQMAINPQIIKSFAAGAYKDVFSLLYQSERITFYLMTIFIVPILLTTKDILFIWLGQVPKYSDIFCQLILLMSFVNALANPFMKIIQADGRLKKNSLYTGTALFLILPISYLFLKLGYDAPIIYVVNLFIYILTFFIRLIIVYDLVQYDIMDYFKRCIIKPIGVIFIPTICAIIICGIIEHSIINVIVFDISVCLFICVFIYFWGLEHNEKTFINKKFLSFYHKFVK